MRRTTPTRTLNPLHFEDLEPHRFEDMVRQLVYDFRNWSSLEAVGRLGADQGIDIQGTELVPSASIVNTLEVAQQEDETSGTDNTEVDTVAPPAASDRRIWQFQCKRERTMNPAKVRAIVRNDLSQQETKPYAYVLVAACDFSKAARDAFRAEVAPFGIQEFYLWGKAELEDMLVQPKNDPLLFAYFGISLQVRRRSVKTDILSKLALKRRLVKVLGGVREDHYVNVLIRDPKDEEYPFIRDSGMSSFLDAPRWRYWKFHGHQPPYALVFLVKRHYAYVDWESGKWDALDDVDTAFPYNSEIHGIAREDHDKYFRPDDLLQRRYWERHVPVENRAYLDAIGFISYERIIAIDELGDGVHEEPHLLVDYLQGDEPFDKIGWYLGEPHYYRRSDVTVRPELDRRISYFPEVLPSEDEQELPQNNLP